MGVEITQVNQRQLKSYHAAFPKDSKAPTTPVQWLGAPDVTEFEDICMNLKVKSMTPSLTKTVLKLDDFSELGPKNLTSAYCVSLGTVGIDKTCNHLCVVGDVCVCISM